MHWIINTLNLVPMLGDVRIVKRFAWLPHTIKSESEAVYRSRVWLQSYYEYQTFNVGGSNDHWYNFRSRVLGAWSVQYSYVMLQDIVEGTSFNQVVDNVCTVNRCDINSRDDVTYVHSNSSDTLSVLLRRTINWTSAQILGQYSALRDRIVYK